MKGKHAPYKKFSLHITNIMISFLSQREQKRNREGHFAPQEVGQAPLYTLTVKGAN